MKMYSCLVAIVWAVLIHHISCQTATRSLKIASTAKITQVYVDGVAVTGVNFGTSWSRSTMFAVAGSSRVLAVKFDSSTKPDAFIIADGTTSCGFYTSPATVKCVTQSSVSRVTNSWYLNTFIDSMWPSASVSSVASKVLVYPTQQFCQQANWMWTESPASVIYCRIRITPVVICPTLNVPNSVLNTTVVSLTTPVRVRCNNGYAFNPRNALNNSIVTVCTGSGRWSPLPSSCQLILCPTLTVPNSVFNNSVASFTSAVRVRCNDGYAIDPRDVLNNSYTTVCTSSGTWSPLPTLCQPVLCLPLNVPNSQLNTTVSNFTTAVRVRCNESYAFDPLNALNNSIDTVCTSNGTWSPLPSSCQQILCPPLNLPNATLNTTATSITTAVRVSCSDGYANDPLNAQLRDYSVETVCTSNGTWSPFTYSCPRARLVTISGSAPALAIAHLNDQFFVIRVGDTQVSVYNATSFQLLQQITFPGFSGFSYGMAASAINNYLYIADVPFNIIHRVDLSVTSPTPAVTSFSIPQFSSGFPVAPLALSVNAAGNVLVGLNGVNYFHEYNSSGALVRTFATNSPVFQAFELNDGKWLISQIFQNALSKITESGAITDTFSSSSTLTFEGPANMAIDTQGYILFTTFATSDVVRVVNPSLTDGRVLPLPDITGLTNPVGLSFDRSRNRLYIGEYGGQYRVLVVLDGVANLSTLFTS